MKVYIVSHLGGSLADTLRSSNSCTGYSSGKTGGSVDCD